MKTSKCRKNAQSSEHSEIYQQTAEKEMSVFSNHNSTLCIHYIIIT